MKDEQFDETLRQVLKDETKNCSMSKEKQAAILDRIHQENKEEQNMNHVSKKKLVIAVAVMCLMASMVAVAAGKITYYQTSTNTDNPTFVTFSDVKKADKDLGYSVRAVEEFANGAAFNRGFISDVDCLDESGNKISSYPELMIDYRLGEKTAFLSAAQEQSTGEIRTPVQSVIEGDKTLNYYEDQYLTLPPNEEASAEDLALEAEGKLFISYGSSEVERKVCNTVIWTDNDVNYILLSWDIAGQELIDMAKEVVNAEVVK